MSFEANALFVCDALPLLERLSSEVITLAYLDPPWNTRATFGPEEAKPVESSNEQYAAYLSRVVQQVRRILKSTGSLFVHWSLVSPLDVRLVMNQAFGEQPKYEITWHKKGPRYQTSRVPRVDSEFILVYSKSDEPIYNPAVRPLLPEETSSYAQRDERGLFRLADLTLPFERPATRFAWRGFQLPSSRSWRFTLDKLESLVQENQIYFPPAGSLPRLKQYLNEHSGIELGTTWDDIPAAIRGRERTGYASQKPRALMERIVQLASNEGDLVLDPFCGSGTTLIAAQSLGRRWWGADSSTEAHHTTVERLLATHGLEAEKDFAVYSEADVTKRSVVDATYRDVIASIEQIAHLQQEVSMLTNHLLSLKRLMNIGEGDDESRVEEAIEQMEHWISVSIANQPRSVESYIAVVCSWLSGWDRLNEASQLFLPQAELLFENITRTKGQDYSPFIIQYCRALENELLIKLFAAYTDDLYIRFEDVQGFLAEDLADDKTRKFAQFLQVRKITYTLGDMAFIMRLMKAGGQTLRRSALLQDFRSFAVQYFSENIMDKAYLDQISIINEDFRRKAAHPNVLDAQAALRCRDLLRTCLNELILNYKGSEDSNVSEPE